MARGVVDGPARARTPPRRAQGKFSGVVGGNCSLTKRRSRAQGDPRRGSAGIGAAAVLVSAGPLARRGEPGGQGEAEEGGRVVGGRAGGRGTATGRSSSSRYFGESIPRAVHAGPRQAPLRRSPREPRPAGRRRTPQAVARSGRGRRGAERSVPPPSPVGARPAGGSQGAGAEPRATEGRPGAAGRTIATSGGGVVERGHDVLPLAPT